MELKIHKRPYHSGCNAYRDLPDGRWHRQWWFITCKRCLKKRTKKSPKKKSGHVCAHPQEWCQVLPQLGKEIYE